MYGLSESYILFPREFMNHLWSISQSTTHNHSKTIKYNAIRSICKLQKPSIKIILVITYSLKYAQEYLPKDIYHNHYLCLAIVALEGCKVVALSRVR